MRSRHGYLLLLLALAACDKPVFAATAVVPSVERCQSAVPIGLAPGSDETNAHLLKPVPPIQLAYGTQLDSNWSSRLVVHVDVQGRITCYVGEDEFGDPMELGTTELAALAAARFQSFDIDGRPSPATVTVKLRREEMPERKRPLPTVPLEEVVLELARSGCFGTCPAYKVTVHGDGHVEYVGSGFTDVQGTVSYRIPREQVQQLVESVRSADLWSLRETYDAPITDNPTYQLRLKFGNQVHCISDYVGAMVGIPHAVTEFEDELDLASGARDLVALNMRGIQHLRDSGFDFRSIDGADLLARANGNGKVDDQTILTLLEAGAPTQGARKVEASFHAPLTLHRGAALNGRAPVLPILFDKGVFARRGKPDPAKINEAFVAAVKGGDLATVQAIWELAGPRARPALKVLDDHDDFIEESHPPAKRIPIVLLLDGERHRGPKPWQGQAIAEWLASHGNDLKARGTDGRTLLHVAAGANDLAFVRYLLAHGVDPALAGSYGTALGGTDSEEVALALLDAGTPLTHWKDQAAFEAYASERPWPRVLVWLKTHPTTRQPAG